MRGEVVGLHGNFQPEPIRLAATGKADFTSVQFHLFAGDGGARVAGGGGEFLHGLFDEGQGCAEFVGKDWSGSVVGFRGWSRPRHGRP